MGNVSGWGTGLRVRRLARGEDEALVVGAQRHIGSQVVQALDAGAITGDVLIDDEDNATAAGKCDGRGDIGLARCVCGRVSPFTYDLYSCQGQY